MKNKLFAGLVLIHLAVFNFQLSTAHAQGTAFTYQGRLNGSGSALSGLYDFRFKLFADPLGNTQVGANYFSTNLPVTGGLFVTTIDFGAGLFNGSNYWLEVDVRTNNPGNTTQYTQLTPFQALTPTPYAVFANTASNVSGTISAAQISGPVSSANLSGTYGNAVTLNNAGNSFAGNGGALTGLNANNLTGILPVASLPAIMVTNTETGVTLGGSFSGNGGGLTSLNASQLTSIGNTNGGINNFFAGPISGSSFNSGFQNTAMGVGTLALNTSGYQNTAIGAQALLNNINGYQNTAVGLTALYNNTNGNGNTAVGVYALENNYSGYQNIAVGQQALYQSTGGNNNIALGVSAGYAFNGNESGNIDIGNYGNVGENNIIRIGTSQTQTYLAGVITGNGGGLTNLNAAQLTGSVPGAALTAVPAASLTGTLPPSTLPATAVTNNETGLTLGGTFSGTYAGNGGGLTSLNASQLTSIGNTNGGIGNTFFGPNSGSSFNSGFQNTAMGVGTLALNTSGYQNTAIGVQALLNNINGYQNTAVGLTTLYNNTNGSGNTAVGTYALENNYSGSLNTALGQQALYQGTGGNNNIALGYYAGYAFTGNESGNIDIGNYGNVGENNIIRIGTSQTQTYLAGVITGNGGGLTNLNAAQLTGSVPGAALTAVPAANLTGTLPVTSLPTVVLTNTETGVNLTGTFSGNGGGLTNLNASQLNGAVPSASLTSVPAASLTGTVPATSLPASVVTNTETGVTLSGTLSGNGAGVTNVNASALNGLNATNFWQLGGNYVATGQFLGSTNNQAVEIRANGGRALRLEPGGPSVYEANGIPTGAPNLIGGSPVNYVAGGVVGASIGGGGATN